MTNAEIVKTEGVLGGKPRLKNHRISVLDITEHVENGQDIAEIAEGLQITVAEVEAAIDYWETHPAEIEEQARRREEVHRQLVEQSRLRREA